MRHVASTLAILIAATGLFACGGGTSRPKPLSQHFDESHIALVPMAEKQDMLSKQQEYHRAKAMFQQIDAKLSEVESDLKVAKNKQKQAVLGEKSAEETRRAADNSADQARIEGAKKELEIAEVQRRAADQRVDYLKAHKKHMKKLALFNEEQMYAKEASYELAKAKLANAKNISPKGFKYDAFKSQASKRKNRAEGARKKADSAKASAAEKKKRLDALEREAARLQGSGASAASDG